MKSPVFNFMVYRVFRMRDSGTAFCRIFEVSHHGLLLAKESAGKHDKHEEVTGLFRRNKVTTWFSSVKRTSVTSVSKEPGDIEYKGEIKLNDKQVDFFSKNRVSY